MIKFQEKLQDFKVDDKYKLNALELLIEIWRVADQEGKFSLIGKYAGGLAPNYLINGKEVLVELGMVKGYPNYTEETISAENDFHFIHQYKLEGTLSKKGMNIYNKIRDNFQDLI